DLHSFPTRRSSDLVPRAQRGNGGGLQTAPNIFPGFFHFVAAMYHRRSQINQLNLWKSSHKAAKPQTGSPPPFLLPSRKGSPNRAPRIRTLPQREIGPLARKIWIIIRIASKHFRPAFLQIKAQHARIFLFRSALQLRVRNRNRSQSLFAQAQTILNAHTNAVIPSEVEGSRGI